MAACSACGCADQNRYFRRPSAGSAARSACARSCQAASFRFPAEFFGNCVDVDAILVFFEDGKPCLTPTQVLFAPSLLFLPGFVLARIIAFPVLPFGEPDHGAQIFAAYDFMLPRAVVLRE